MALTATQKQVLETMSERNIGALFVPSLREYVGQGYVFPNRVRASNFVAVECLKELARNRTVAAAEASTN